MVWHYTLGVYIYQIVESGEIRLSNNTKDRPIVWFSSNPDWEETARRNFNTNGVRIPLDRQETEKYGHGLYRIGVYPDRADLKPWLRLKSMARLSPRSVELLVSSAESVGANPYDWWGSVSPVPKRYWESIERFENGEWKSIFALSLPNPDAEDAL